MKKILRSFGALAATLLLASCFEMSSTMTVAKDGSGTVEETTLVSAQMKAMMSSLGAAGGQPDGGGGSGEMKMDILPTKEKATEKAGKMGPGVTLKSLEDVKAPDGREGVKVVYAFTDVRTLKYEPGDMNDVSKEGVSFGLEGNTLTVNLPENKPGSKPEAAPEPAPAGGGQNMEAQMAMMKPMFAGMRVSFTLKAAGGIASTDAAYPAGDAVTLLEINFDKLMESPEGMKKFGSLMDKKDTSPQEAAEVFKGMDGVKIETKEKVTVTLK